MMACVVDGSKRTGKGEFMGERIQGACLCGKVAYEISAAEAMGGCHCTRCQRWTGTGGAMVLIVAPSNFKVTQGKDLIKQYQEEGFANRYFCSNCGSSLYGEGEKLYVGAGTAKATDMKPAFHI